jgi:hypothetical protein
MNYARLLKSSREFQYGSNERNTFGEVKKARTPDSYAKTP